MNKKLIVPAILVMVIILMVAIPISSAPLQCIADDGECYESNISRVIDGDTIKDHQDQSIRLSLVSAPELGEEEGKDSKAFLEAICPKGSRITIDEDIGQLQGSYGRTIAQVHCNGVSLNAEMVFNNHATIDTKYCADSEFAFEDWAKGPCGLEDKQF